MQAAAVMARCGGSPGSEQPALAARANQPCVFVSETHQPQPDLLRSLEAVRAPAALVVLDGKPRVAAANKAFLSVLSPTAAPERQHPLAWAYASDTDQYVASFGAALAEGAEWTATLSAIAKARFEVVTFSALMLPMFAGDGRQWGLLRLASNDSPDLVAQTIVRACRFTGSDKARRAPAKPPQAAAGADMVVQGFRLVSDLLRREVEAVRDDRVRSMLLSLRDKANCVSGLVSVASGTEGGLPEWVAAVCEASRLRWSGEKVSLEVDVVDSEGLRGSHAMVLMVAVQEIVGNAVRHAFAGRASGTVAVRVRTCNGAICAKIADNGCGIADDALVRGTYGLRMVEALVKEMGGVLILDSGQGTYATIRIPLPR